MLSGSLCNLHMRKKGFTIVEVLVAIAIVGIISVILVPNLLTARRVAVDRSVQAYGSTVFKAANAYISTETEVVVGNIDCLNGLELGSYSVKPLSAKILISCSLTMDGSGYPIVNVVSVYSVGFTFP
jgi:type IV pilus assembly protein PilA